MDAAVFGYIEATLVFVIVVGWGARELWLLKRDRDARRQDGNRHPCLQHPVHEAFFFRTKSIACCATLIRQ